MGIYDRDYYRREGPSFLGSITNRSPVVTWLIIINALVFLAQLLTIPRLAGMRTGGDGSFTDALALTPALVLEGQVWRLLTGAFLHSTLTPWHIILNMFVLWWAGSQMEELRGSKEFLCFYLAAAIFSSVVYVATSMPMQFLGSAVGASGAVTAVLVLFACHYPYRTLLLMMVIPVPAWLLVVLYVGQDFLVWISQQKNGVAVTGHIGGALFGFIYFRAQWRLSGFTSWFADWKRARSRPKLRLYREEEPAPAAVVSARAPLEQEIDEHLEAKLDAVLEKVNLVGKDKLTDAEKDILLKASEIYRRRRN